MPVYEHLCATCGAFEELRVVESAGETAECPSCGEPGPRSYRLAPGSSPVGAHAAGQNERLERAQTGEPRTETTRRAGNSGVAHGHEAHARPWTIGH